MHLNKRTSALAVASAAIGLFSLPPAVLADPPGCLVAGPPAVLQADAQRTVVINDPAILQKAGVDFSLSRTLGAIIASAQGASAATPANELILMTSLLKNLNAASFTNPVSNVAFPVTPRPSEAKLDPKKLLDPANADGMRVVGLFNRFDLAPADWKYCGEHRIVYEKGAPVSQLNRLTLIFEAALTNPDPNLKPEGCVAVAKFWAGLKSETDPKKLATALETFYYKGIGGGFQPVVHFTHYGLPFGQVRANMFVTPPVIWQLREWHTALNQNGSVEFQPATVKVNAEPTLYGESIAGEDPKATALRTSFQNDFIAKFLPALLSVDEAGVASGHSISVDDFFFSFGVPIDEKYDSFQSTANGAAATHTEDDPLKIAQSGDLLARISTAMSASDIPSSCRPTSQQILARAGVQTCGGCHEFSVGQSLSSTANVQWPASDGFVQIDERGTLSPLLSERLLPSRIKNLEAFLAAHPSVASLTTASRLSNFSASIMFPPGQRTLSTEAVSKILSDAMLLRDDDRHTAGAFMKFRPAD